MFTKPTILALVAAARLTAAHTAFTTLFVNGQSQGDGTCVRMNKDAATATFPIKDITSSDMACGMTGLQQVNRTCPLKAGDTVSFQYRGYPDGSQPGIIAYNHSGPCAVYMKKVSDASPSSDPFQDNNAAGDGWFKVMYQGYDDASGKWCTNSLNESSEGVISAAIPSDVASGYYLLRPELLALHAAASEGDPQFYTGCAQVYIDGGTGTATPETASIPGYVSYDTPAMKFNVWAQPMALPYPEYGPKLYGGSGGAAGAGGEATAVAFAAATTAIAVTNGSSAVSIRRSIWQRRQRRSARMKHVIIDAVNGTDERSLQSANTSIATTTTTTTSGRDNGNGSDNIHTLRRRNSTDHANEFGNCPNATVLEVGNWCGVELDSYTSSSGSGSDSDTTNCWSASKTCWAQADTCWANCGPAVHSGQNPSTACYLWNDRCTEIDDACKAGQTSGPPNQGKARTLQARTIGSVKVGVS